MRHQNSNVWWWIAGGVALAALTLGGTREGRSVVEQAVAIVSGRKAGPRWERMHPDLRALVERVEREAAAEGLDVMFWDGWRDPGEVVENIAAGTSRLKDPFNSMHVWGLAADIVFRGALGQPVWPPEADPRWRRLAEIMERVGLDSGGLSWGWDWPHAQMRGYSLNALRAQYGKDFLAFIGSGSYA